MTYKSSKIASNSPPKCLKPFSNPYMMPKSQSFARKTPLQIWDLKIGISV